MCAPEDDLAVLASEPTSAALRHSQWNAVGSELVAQAKVQASASGAWYPGATRQWLPCVPSCERNSDEQFRSIAEIASAETRTRRRLASYGHDLHARDQRGRKANCGTLRVEVRSEFTRYLCSVHYQFLHQFPRNGLHKLPIRFRRAVPSRS